VASKVADTIKILQQQLNTRANMLDMSRRLGIYKKKPDMTPDQIVNDMRSRILINRNGNFVTVSFSAPSAQMSAEVTNDIVTQILQANVAMRTQASGQTLEFFDQEVSRLNEDLSRQSDKNPASSSWPTRTRCPTARLPPRPAGRAAGAADPA